MRQGTEVATTPFPDRVARDVWCGRSVRYWVELLQIDFLTYMAAITGTLCEIGEAIESLACVMIRPGAVAEAGAHSN